MQKRGGFIKNIGIVISTFILILAIVYSAYKFNRESYNNSEYTVRYGENVSIDDIIVINGETEKVIKINEDGSYITEKTK